MLFYFNIAGHTTKAAFRTLSSHPTSHLSQVMVGSQSIYSGFVGPRETVKRRENPWNVDVWQSSCLPPLSVPLTFPHSCLQTFGAAAPIRYASGEVESPHQLQIVTLQETCPCIQRGNSECISKRNFIPIYD